MKIIVILHHFEDVTGTRTGPEMEPVPLTPLLMIIDESQQQQQQTVSLHRYWNNLSYCLLLLLLLFCCLRSLNCFIWCISGLGESRVKKKNRLSKSLEMKTRVSSSSSHHHLLTPPPSSLDHQFIFSISAFASVCLTVFPQKTSHEVREGSSFVFLCSRSISTYMSIPPPST